MKTLELHRLPLLKKNPLHLHTHWAVFTHNAAGAEVCTSQPSPATTKELRP